MFIFKDGKNVQLVACGFLKCGTTPCYISIVGIVSAMVSARIKSSQHSNKHLAKTFYFVLSFLFIKPNQKDLEN